MPTGIPIKRCTPQEMELMAASIRRFVESHPDCSKFRQYGMPQQPNKDYGVITIDLDAQLSSSAIHPSKSPPSTNS